MTDGDIIKVYRIIIIAMVEVVRAHSSVLLSTSFGEFVMCGKKIYFYRAELAEIPRNRMFFPVYMSKLLSLYLLVST